MPRHKMIILCGPSGSGKTTLAKNLLKKMPVLSFSTSATTRPKRHGEENAKDYYFLTPDEFKSRIENDEFVEYEEVYRDIFYGTLKAELQRIWDENKVPVLDIDVVGAMNIKKNYAPTALAIFVHPVTIQNVKDRLQQRATESEESYEKRIMRAVEELDVAGNFDKVIYNDELEPALVNAEQYVEEYLLLDEKTEK